jgi:hypothetical protein
MPDALGSLPLIRMNRRQNTHHLNMRRTLSSRATIFWNFVLPILLIAGLSCALLLCWLGKIKETDGKPMRVEEICLFTLVWAAIVGVAVKSIGVLKRVEVDDDALYISNYHTEVRIPLSEVTGVRQSRGKKDLTKVSIGLRSRSAFGKTVEFLPRLRLNWSGTHPAVRELKVLCQQASARNGVDQPTPFDPAEKIFEAGDDCVQVGNDYILYGCEGKDEVCEKDKFFFKDLARITVIRRKKSGRITAIDYKVKGKSGTFEIGDYKPEEMEEIARLLETRAKSWPIQFLEKRVAGSNPVALIIGGLGAIAATICGGWLLHFFWTMRDQLQVGLGLLFVAVICLGTLGVAALLWVAVWEGLWRALRD